MALPEEQARYVVRVHRKRIGEHILLFDPARGEQALARLVEDRLPNVVVEVGEPEAAPKSNMPVTLIQALGKADKPEQAVRDATAFGARAVDFVVSTRTVARPKGERGDRLARVAEQVARQCGRGDLPDIRGPEALEDALGRHAQTGGALRLVCAAGVEARPFVRAVKESAFPSQPVVILIGPEGGWDPIELEKAMVAGFVAVSLGPYVLRTETAAGAVLATLRLLSDAESDAP
jgi:16S rRNA (uracil1498-N3)-methyltransferase